MTDSADKYLVPGLVRGVQVMQLFTPDTPELSLAEIAGHLGISRSAAFRCVFTLESLGCLTHDGAAHRYRLGPGVLRLGYGYLATRETVEAAQPVLGRLRDATGWSAHLGVLDGTSVLYTLRLPAPRSEESIVHVGSRLPARSTSLGRVLLAALKDEEIVARFRGDLSAAPGRMAAVLAQAAADRDLEAVVHLGDFQAGVASVAAGVRDRSGRVVAAASLTAPATSSVAQAIERDIRAALLAAVSDLSVVLGYGTAG